jgi:hypothetical protein
MLVHTAPDEHTWRIDHGMRDAGAPQRGGVHTIRQRCPRFVVQVETPHVARVEDEEVFVDKDGGVVRYAKLVGGGGGRGRRGG